MARPLFDAMKNELLPLYGHEEALLEKVQRELGLTDRELLDFMVLLGRILAVPQSPALVRLQHTFERK